MFERFQRVLRFAFGDRSISVERESPSRLELRYAYTRTVFDQSRQQIIQDGRLVASRQQVERVELHQPRDQEGPLNWFVTVHINGSKRVEVGQVTEEAEASMIGAKIATVADRPVAVGR